MLFLNLDAYPTSETLLLRLNAKHLDVRRTCRLVYMTTIDRGWLIVLLGRPRAWRGRKIRRSSYAFPRGEGGMVRVRVNSWKTICPRATNDNARYCSTCTHL